MERQIINNNNFKIKVYNLVGNEYSVISNYQNKRTKLKMKHNKCGTIFLITPTAFFVRYKYHKNSYPACPICRKLIKTKQLTNKFKNKVKKLHGNQYTVLSYYKNNRTEIKIRHNKCGCIFSITPDKFLNWKQCKCPKCRKSVEINKRTNWFKLKVKKFRGNQYSVIGKYKNLRTKILIKHNKCGFVYKVTPEEFLSGYGLCPICHKAEPMNTRRFKFYVKKLVGNEYTILGHYKNESTKIKIRHNKCGYIFYMQPGKFLAGERCPKCRGEIIRTPKLFIDEVFAEVGNEYSVLGKYINCESKVKMRHNKCGHIFYMRPEDFLVAHHRCPYCYGTHKKNTNEFKEEVKNIVGNEYTVLGQYKNRNTKIKMRHNKCGYVYYVTPSMFFRGRRCPYCCNNHPMSDKAFRNLVKKIVGNKYTVLGHYRNCYTKIKIRHNKCGYVYYVTPTSFITKGSRCPHCFSSHGESLVGQYLRNHHYKECASARNVKNHFNTFSHSYHIRYKHHLLSYDFLIHINNKLYVIEFDGAQHFRVADFSNHYCKYIKNHTLAIKKPKVYHKLMKRLVNQNQHDIWKEKWSLEHLHHPVIRIKNPKNLNGKALRKLVKNSLNKAFNEIKVAYAVKKIIQITKNW